MGGGSSHHHYHTDTESQQRAVEAEKAAAEARALAEATQKAFEEQQRRNQELFEQQRRAQEQAAEAARRAQEEYQRQLREAQEKQQAEAEAAARRLEAQRKAKEEAEEKARQDAAAAAKRLQEEQARRMAEAAEAARRLEEERAAAERRVQQELEEERARVHEDKLREWQALNREYPIPEFLKEYISEVLADATANAAQDRRVNVGVLGDSGTGKSSLIKAILEHFSSSMDQDNIPRPVSCFEGDGTRAPQRYALGEFNGKACIWDLPGQGTSLFPSRTYLRDMGLKYFDAVLVISDGRWSENDGSLLQAIKFAGIWCCIVRTKVDQAVDDGREDHNMDQEETLKRIRETLSDQVQETDPKRIHLVTTRKKYWTGLHGGLKFGSIDTLCEMVAEHVEAEIRGATGQAQDAEMPDAEWSIA